ncbi:hypothetical protein A0H81_06399 [Grifola frondosa]|uniref:WLM domain-containing protein n=1 Tax=Grifola frondosa TaxID=5627 RepID=A0A1C7MBJ7_GRIFR|nr:hypothetical protein A0H81_06399 [Grifola frondosa]
MASDLSSASPIELTISHRGSTHRLSLLPHDTLAYLHARLEELTSVPPENQKLLYKVQMGPTAEELGGLRAVEDEQKRRARILRERAARVPAKLRSTASPSAASSQYTFHRIEPLPHLPNPPAARALLERLAADLAIRHVMRTHQLAVGLLTELAPHESPHLLGLNVNAGQAVKLRLRTDAYDGFRTYAEVRRVLCHELTHNVWAEHDNNFKELNSTLNREVAQFERAEKEGTHYLAEPAGGIAHTALELEAQERVLGGLGGSQVLGGPGAVSAGEESPEERRRRMLEATMRRLQKEEEELEERCGTSRTN